MLKITLKQISNCYIILMILDDYYHLQYIDDGIKLKLILTMELNVNDFKEQFLQVNRIYKKKK